MAIKYLSGLAANLATSATTITPSSEDANYDADNVGNGWPAQKFKFNAAAADDTLDFNFGSAKAPTLVGIHGHNIDSGITSITVISDTASSFAASPTTEATILFAAIASPTTYKLISAPTSRQYWRLKFNGTNGNPIELGEISIGIASTLSKIQLKDWTINESRPQIRVTGKDIPQNLVNNLTDFYQKQISLTFIAENTTERDELRDAFFTNTNWGTEPIIIIPDPNDDFIIHGRVIGNIAWARIPGGSGGYYKTTIKIEEDPFSLSFP